MGINPKNIILNYTLFIKQALKYNIFAFIIIIFYNNQGAITLIKNPINYSKIKYIYTKYIFLREYISNNQVKL